MSSTPPSASARSSPSTGALEQGTLVNRVASPTYALADMAAAHEAVERGTIGNVVVTM